ncbi:predicted protein [Naegleria gruberi]|uniref:Predicted protein n=1 Tax=Naegleria gruberi TaxID=5762 RepID=D2VCL4_NAEGR|nr:uncharacterized protein NAEGRDRAFT_66614 [Naegleria gruberi]EFC45437.1 predicted protein [Naegleria gruberi]|eukprot:XP_002678181.1 predicted protein [Naegleria gruberi strain NEG-M]
MSNLIETSAFKWARLIMSFPTRSIKVMWLLNELNLPIRDISKETDYSSLNVEQDSAIQVRFVRLETGEHMNPLKNPHPFHKVPCLEYQLKGEETKHVLFESNAILMFLLENFDTEKKLSPSTSVYRTGLRYQIMMWVSSSLEQDISPAMKIFKTLLQKKGLNIMNKHLLTFEPEEKEEFDKASAIIRESYLPHVEKLLSERDPNSQYLFDNQVDIADICLGFGLKGCDTCGLLDEKLYPNCKKYYGIMCATASHGKAMQQMMKMFTESLSK